MILKNLIPYNFPKLDANLQSTLYMVIQSLFVLKRWLFFCRSMCAICRGRVNIRHWPAQHWFDEFRQCWRGLTSGLTNAICRSRLKAGNRYNERRRPDRWSLWVRKRAPKNAARLEQPAAIFVSYSVISFIQGNAGENATCSTLCRREYAAVALSWNEFPQKFRLLSIFRIFILFIGIAKKINDPFPLLGIPRLAFRWIIIIPIFAETMLYYTTVIWSVETIMSIVASASRHSRTNFSLKISGKFQNRGLKKLDLFHLLQTIHILKKKMIISLTNRNITNEHVARSINHSRYRDHRFRFSISACFFFKHFRRDGEWRGGKRGVAINSARAA